MSAIEFVGFVISFIAMIVLFFKQAIEKKRRQQNPELYEAIQHNKQKRLKEFLQALDVQHERSSAEDDDDDEWDDDDEESLAAPPPPVKLIQAQASKPLPKPQRSVYDGYRAQTKIEQLKSLPTIEKRPLPTNIGDSYKNRFVAGSIGDADLHRDVHQDPYALSAGLSNARVLGILNRLESAKDMVVLHEVIGPPKALR